MNDPLLSTEEKRRWLARVFRDTDGEYSQADKFKALVEDTKLAALQQEEEEFKRQSETGTAERLDRRAHVLVISGFQSTPSLRRATRTLLRRRFLRMVSIHALLAESDLTSYFPHPK